MTILDYVIGLTAFVAFAGVVLLLLLSVARGEP
jgi:hypothetical protein